MGSADHLTDREPRGGVFIALIYRIINLKNNKQYIGQTIQTLETRKQKHISSSRNDKQLNYSAIARAIRKYGEDSFRFEILEEDIDEKDLDLKEIYYIQKYNTLAPNGYNITTGGKRGVKNTSIKNEEIENLYHVFKSTRAVANYLGVTHDCISERLKSMGVILYNPREQFGKKVVLEKDGLSFSFPSKPDCAEWLIKNKITSAKVESIRSKLRNNSYYLGYKVTIG